MTDMVLPCCTVPHLVYCLCSKHARVCVCCWWDWSCRIKLEGYFLVNHAIAITNHDKVGVFCLLFCFVGCSSFFYDGQVVDGCDGGCYLKKKRMTNEATVPSYSSCKTFRFSFGLLAARGHQSSPA